MSPALRRSRRSQKQKGYSVGDIVEIKRRSRKYTGRLVYRLTEDKESPNPLWLVTFDGQEGEKDEEIYEKHFGAILEKGKKGDTENVAQAQPAVVERPKRKGVRTAAAATTAAVASSAVNDNAGTNMSSSSGDENKLSGGKRGGKKSVAVRRQQQQQKESIVEKDDKESPVSASAVSDSSAPPAPVPPKSLGRKSTLSSFGGRMSAREQRSLRRQAKIDEEAAVKDTRIFGGRKRGISGPSLNERISDLESKRPRKDEDNGEVVKVKLKTGTLYLYKGLHRRAEFIRRY